MGIEKYIKTIEYKGDIGNFEIPEEANFYKITLKGIKFYKDIGNTNVKRRRKYIKIPKGVKSLSYKIRDSKIEIECRDGFQRLIQKWEKEISKTIPLVELEIKRGEEIEIPTNAKSYRCRKGKIIFYSLEPSEAKGLKPIIKGVRKLRFDNYEKIGANYFYGDPEFD